MLEFLSVELFDTNGIVMTSRLIHPLNAEAPISTVESGIAIWVNLL